MEGKDLVSVWRAPDNTRLTPWQMSIRLPVRVAARIGAACEMFPRKSRTEIIADLLSVALDQLEEGLSDKAYEGEYEEGERMGMSPLDLQEAVMGDRGYFQRLVDKHEKKLEEEVAAAKGEGEETKGKRGMATEQTGRAKGAPRGGSASVSPGTSPRPAGLSAPSAPRRQRRPRRGRRPPKG